MALPPSPPGSAYSSSAESTVTIIHHSLNCICPDLPLWFGAEDECLQLQNQQYEDHRSLTEVAPKPKLSIYKEQGVIYIVINALSTSSTALSSSIALPLHQAPPHKPELLYRQTLCISICQFGASLVQPIQFHLEKYKLLLDCV